MLIGRPRSVVVAVAGALVAVGLVVLMVVLVEARPAEATFPGQNGKIAYDAYDGTCLEEECYGGTGHRIYTINPDGGGKFQVTDSAGPSDYSPSYSPNGKRIAYVSSDGHDAEIYTIKATGGKPFQVTHTTTKNYSPSWGSRS